MNVRVYYYNLEPHFTQNVCPASCSEQPHRGHTSANKLLSSSGASFFALVGDVGVGVTVGVDLRPGLLGVLRLSEAVAEELRGLSGEEEEEELDLAL